MIDEHEREQRLVDSFGVSMSRALEERLRDLAAQQLELSNDSLTIAERHARVHDELERLADRLYAAEQDLLEALFRVRGTE